MRLIQGWVLLVCVLIGACGGEPLPPLVTSNLNLTAPMPGKSMSAGYLSITNNTDETIVISRVESSQFETVQIHESVLDDGISKMNRLEKLAIPANSTVTLEPGGKHLMLMRPSTEAQRVSLQFYSEDTLLLSVSAPLTTRIN